MHLPHRYLFLVFDPQASSKKKKNISHLQYSKLLILLHYHQIIEIIDILLSCFLYGIYRLYILFTLTKASICYVQCIAIIFNMFLASFSLPIPGYFAFCCQTILLITLFGLYHLFFFKTLQNYVSSFTQYFLSVLCLLSLKTLFFFL